MELRKKAALLNIFLDDGLETELLAQAAQLVVATEPIVSDKEECKQNSSFVIDMLDDQFKEQFRMERSSFEKLLSLMHGVLAGGERHEPILRVPLAEKLLYTLTLLAGRVGFREAGDTFGISNSSGHEIFKWVTAALSTMLPIYVKWPENDCGRGAGPGELSGVVGVIDECHIPLKAAIAKCNHLALQAVCDRQSRFLDVYIDVPNEQQCLLLKSPLFERLIDMNEPLMPKNNHLVGEMTYPLLLNLMTPFKELDALTPCHLAYNRAVHLWNAPVERAFAALLSRFRRLECLDVASVEVGRMVISASCMLHNFILDCGENIEDSILDFEMLPEYHCNLMFEEHDLLDEEFTSEAERKRNTLVASFLYKN